VTLILLRDIDAVERECVSNVRDESRFWEEMEKHIDLNNSTHLWLNTANRWTGIRLVGHWAFSQFYCGHN